ncbi:MAG: DUF1847 domain-containing protein [Thermoanaerobacteraceae bacterium]|nr:DUF1847 domain-containing protein [Thermoanaerobacteraceae bacterium]
MKCAACEKNSCYLEGKDCTGGKFAVDEYYRKPEDDAAHRVSTWLEGSFYMQLTRLEEIIRFAKEMNYKKLGIAFCIGFSHEAKLLNKLLERDFKVSSVCCKVTGHDKETRQLKKIIQERYEAMCNPILQAEILNRDETDLNILLGLCVGHDILFTKYSKAPVTTFAVKDRVLAHNPLGALYSNYYLSKKFKLR